jgi:prepilin-type processing-associated H-X9-DG protein
VLPPGVVNRTGPIIDQPRGYHFGWLTQILPHMEMRNVYNHFNFSQSLYQSVNDTTRGHLVRSFLCPSDNGPNRNATGAAATSYAGNHHDREAPIAADNNGVLFLNSFVRYEDISDGTSQTIFLGEKRNDGLDLGWASGTRASLRNAGSGINLVGLPGGNSPFAAGGNPQAPGSPAPGDAAAPGSPAANGTAAAAADDTARFVGSYSSRHPGGANFTFGDGSVRFLKSTITREVFRLLSNRADGEIIDGDKF